MQAKFVTAVLLGFVLIGASACGGGGNDGAKIAELEKRLAAAEEAQQEAEVDPKKPEEEPKEPVETDADKRVKEAQAKAADEEKKRLAAEQAQKDAEAAAEKARQEAARAIEEAETQANAAVRAPFLITKLSDMGGDDKASGAGVRHTLGEKRTFTRPLGIPTKGSAPSVPGSWASASYSGPRGTTGTDTVYLYTNIQAPGSKAFWKAHGESKTVIAGVVPDTPRVTISGFGTQAKKLFPDHPTDGEVTKVNQSRGGTYDGYSGTFKCADACNIVAADGGALTFGGDWTFTASPTAKRSSKQAEQDTEFLYFGIWAYEPTVATDLPELRWAAGGDANGGDAGIDSANFAALTGTATFTGGAIGKYALAKVGGRAARIGTFTATATFTADFDKNPDDSDGNRLSGRLTAFKEGGSDLGSDWHVFLGGSSSTAAGLDASGTTGDSTTTHGAIDGDKATGVWAATLHGSDNYDEFTGAQRIKYPESKYPVADVAGVAGWFNAAAGANAAIAGAFGAGCTTGTMCAK